MRLPTVVLRDAVIDGLDSAVVGAIGEPTRETAVDNELAVDIVPKEATFEALATRVVEAAAPSYSE
jgi:uroporphyrinogen-III synthase (EC 4.2.1.75)